MEFRSEQLAFGVPVIAISTRGRAVGLVAVGRVAVVSDLTKLHEEGVKRQKRCDPIEEENRP